MCFPECNILWMSIKTILFRWNLLQRCLGIFGSTQKLKLSGYLFNIGRNSCVSYINGTMVSKRECWFHIYKSLSDHCHWHHHRPHYDLHQDLHHHAGPGLCLAEHTGSIGRSIRRWTTADSTLGIFPIHPQLFTKSYSTTRSFQYHHE